MVDGEGPVSQSRTPTLGPSRIIISLLSSLFLFFEGGEVGRGGFSFHDAHVSTIRPKLSPERPFSFSLSLALSRLSQTYTHSFSFRMAALANYQRLARMSRISQLETLAIPPRPAAVSSSSSPSAFATATHLATGQDKPSNSASSSSSSRRQRAATVAAAGHPPTRSTPPQSPKQINTIPEHDGGGGGDQEDENEDDGDDFWSPPTSPVEERQEPQYHRVATDIRISLLGPDPALLAADSDEFKRQAKEIKKDLQRLSRYTRHQHSNPATLAEYSRLQRVSSSPSVSASAVFFLPGAATTTTVTTTTTTTNPATDTTVAPPPQSSPPPPLELELEALQQEHEFRRRFSIQEGRDFLSDFLRVHFAAHRDHVAIRADAASARTLEEIKMIGNEEDVASGVRQCRRLFNAPVLSDRVGSLLYEELRQGDDLDHSHEWRPFVTDSDDEDEDEDEGEGEWREYGEGMGNGYYYDEYDDVVGGSSWDYGIRMDHKDKKKKDKKNRKQLPPEELRRRRVDEFERSKAEFLEMRQLAAATQNGTAHCKCTLLGGPRAGQATSMFGCMACSPPPPGGRSSVPNTMTTAAAGPQKDGPAEEELDPFSRDLLAGRKSVDSILSGVKRRTFRGAEYIAASLAAGYQ